MSEPNSPSNFFDEDDSQPLSPLNEARKRELSETGAGGEQESAAPAEKKRRIIRNPMPKLNPDRICGPRGIGILPKVMSDFKPKGESFRRSSFSARLFRLFRKTNF